MAFSLRSILFNTKTAALSLADLLQLMTCRSGRLVQDP